MNDSKQRDERLKQFEKAARSLGAAFEQLHLSEEDVLTSLEDTRQKLYDERYGQTKP